MASVAFQDLCPVISTSTPLPACQTHSSCSRPGGQKVLGCPSPGLLGEHAAPGHLQPALSPAPTQGARENREPDVGFPHLSLVDC